MELGVSKYDVIYADSVQSRKSIEELHRMGWNVKPTAKGSDSVMAGIDMLKRYKIYVQNNAQHLITEFQNYKWQEDKNGNLMNKPVDNYNHAIDALRYAVWNTLSRPNYGKVRLALDTQST